MEKLFPKFIIATKAMALCCDSGDGRPSPVASSEVYNETWMLRLTLALLHDYEGEFEFDGLQEHKKEKAALNKIRQAIRVQWISEGGLEPAFEKEGTTWTDAILGNVSVRGDSKRGVSIEARQHGVGVVVVEAKMGSDLSSGVTNSTDYDQAARNIACLSRLLLNNPDMVGNSCFCVFVPGVDGNREKVDSAQLKIAQSVKTIKCQKIDRVKNEGRQYNVEAQDIEKFEARVAELADNSVAITWETIISSMKSAEGVKELEEYYKKAKREMPKVCKK